MGRLIVWGLGVWELRGFFSRLRSGKGREEVAMKEQPKVFPGFSFYWFFIQVLQREDGWLGGFSPHGCSVGCTEFNVRLLRGMNDYES